MFEGGVLFGFPTSSLDCSFTVRRYQPFWHVLSCLSCWCCRWNICSISHHDDL